MAVVKYFDASISSASGAGSLIVNDAGEFTGFASTEARDQVGDVMVSTGCVTRGNNDVPLLLQHDKNLLVGRAKLLPQAGIVRMFAKFAPIGISQIADQWRQLVALGIATDLSIGFVELKGEPLRGGGRKISSWLCIEVSIVTIGCNQEALIKPSGGSKDADSMARQATLAKMRRQHEYEMALAGADLSLRR